jgi:hypothetical protein
MESEGVTIRGDNSIIRQQSTDFNTHSNRELSRDISGITSGPKYSVKDLLVGMPSTETTQSGSRVENFSIESLNRNKYDSSENSSVISFDVTPETSNTYENSFTSSRVISKTINSNNLLEFICYYSGRSILFVLFFCVTTACMSFILLWYFDVKYDYYVNGTKEFAKCLAEKSFYSPIQTQEAVDQYAEEQCGHIPSVRPVLGEVCFYNIT